MKGISTNTVIHERQSLHRDNLPLEICLKFTPPLVFNGTPAERSSSTSCWIIRIIISPSSHCTVLLQFWYYREYCMNLILCLPFRFNQAAQTMFPPVLASQTLPSSPQFSHFLPSSWTRLAKVAPLPVGFPNKSLPVSSADEHVN